MGKCDFKMPDVEKEMNLDRNAFEEQKINS